MSLEGTAHILIWLIVIVIILVVLFFLLDRFVLMSAGVGYEEQLVRQYIDTDMLRYSS